MGEEIDFEKSQSSDSNTFKFFKTPSVNDVLQESTDTSQAIIKKALNKGFLGRTDYDKLCLSLLSGLPNEQELALNVCTILSNEGNYMLHLEQAPKLVDLLVAQTGVWPLEDDALKMLYLESWKGLKGQNVHRFWRSTLDVQNEQIVQLLGLDLGEYDSDYSLLNVESYLGAHNVEGQRIARVALILHNLSFEKNNVPVLITNKNFMRFMLVSIHSSWGNLKQIAYDTLSNLASAIKLSIEKDVCSRLIFQTVMDGILSLDRYMNVRSMDILSQLCSFEANEDIIPSRLDVEVYQRMVSFLTVHDIMLLFYTLEALYALSDLGRYACDKIVSVHRSIGALVSLLTLEPSEYGPSGQINMKVVKHMVPAEFDSGQESTVTATEETPSSPVPVSTSTSTTTPAPTATPTQTTITTATPAPIATPTQTTTITHAPPSIPMPVITPNDKCDAETFIVTWLKATYEMNPGKTVTRNEIYSDYITFCTKAGRKDIANANVFTEYLKKTFPGCSIRKTESKGIFTFHHDGLYRKYPFVPAPVKSFGNNTYSKAATSTASCRPNQNTTFNSILKTQLSSSPRSNVAATPLKSLSPAVKVLPSPSTSSTTPRTATPAFSNAGSSTLIKSLLASKVQQRNLPSQVLPQNVSKMVIYTPGSSGLLGSTTTVVRCIRPGSLHAVNLGTQLRSPLQTCLVSNSGRIITNTSPRIVKGTAVLRPNLQSHVASIQPQVANAQHQVNNVQSQVANIQHQLNNVQPQVSNVQHQLNNIQSQAATVQHQLNNTQSQVANVQHQLHVQPQVANVQPQVANVQHQLNVQPQVANVQHQLSVQPQVANVQHQLNVQPQVANAQHQVQHQVTNVQHQVSNVQHQVTNVQHQVSNVQQQVTNVQHQVSNVQQQVTNVPQLANVHYQVGNMQPPVSNIQPQFLNVQNQMVSVQPQTTDGQSHMVNLQSQLVKQGIVSSSTTRINGLQKDIKLDVEDDNLKMSTDVPCNFLSHLTFDQNHVAKGPDINQHSTLLNGEGLQSTNSVHQNDMNFNSTSVIQKTPDFLKVAVKKELPTSESYVIINPKQLTTDFSPIKEEKDPVVYFESKIPLEQPSVQSTKALSSPTSILKSVLSDLDTSPDLLNKQQQQIQKDICKRAPLLNGLLDKGKLPTQLNLPSNAVILNGNEPTTLEVVNSKVENKSPQFVQLNQNFVIPVSSLNTVISPQQSNLILMPVSSMNSVITSSSINSSILASMNSPTTFISASNQTVPLSVPNSVLPSTTFLSNGSNLMQLCIGQTTLSGTAEVQSDQQGVVRLHIESPENSNQGSDLSSISDITRTLECASKALLKTNAECNSQISFTSMGETTLSTSVTTTNSSILSRTGQQFFVVTPSLNQPQLQIQQPNIKFHILHSVPKVDDSVDLISFSNVNINQGNQIQQPHPETSAITSTCLKRPSSDTSPIQAVSNAKKPCIETKTSLLAESLRTPTSVPCTFDLASVSARSGQETKSMFTKSSQIENAELISKLAATTKTIAKQASKMDLPCEKGARTLSGLSSMHNIQSQTPSPVPSKSTAGLEFLCEWKNCGLKFPNPGSVFLHASKVHTPFGSNDMVCLWEGCDSVKRKRLSLLTHLQDWHCNETVLQTQALRRKQIAQTGKSSIAPPQKPPPHPGYAPDAALLAIKRHALQYINPKELSEEKESVLTKSIRLTSALILRNLVTHSTLARSHVRRFEPELAYLAMSPVESARTLAQCLSQLYSTHD